MAYITVEELRVTLQLEAPTQIQMERMQRVLDAAAAEIDWELGYTALSPAPSPVPQLVATVNLERAVEHWRQADRPPGVTVIGDSEPVIVARNSWYRHAIKLTPLKHQWGFA